MGGYKGGLKTLFAAIVLSLLLTPTPESPAIDGGDEWLSGSEFSDGVRHFVSFSSESSDRPPKERRNHIGKTRRDLSRGVFTLKYKPASNTETESASASTPELTPTLTPLSSGGGTMGMRIEGITEENGAVTVLTTGAKFLIERDGTVIFWQRIPRERKVLETRLPETTFPFRVEREGDFAVNISYESASLTIQADSVAILKLNKDFRTTFQGLITPSYNAENNGRRLLIDAEGGFGIYPVSTSTPNSIESSWRITYSFSRGEEVWLSVFPPRPYNRQRSFESIAHEHSLGDDDGNYLEYPSNEVIRSDGRYNKVFALHGYVGAVTQINMRSAPTKTAGLLGTQPVGARGTIIDGPVEQYSDTIWWQVRYDNNLIGWTIEDFFTPLDRPFRIGDRIQTKAAAPWRATRHVPFDMDEFRRVRDEVHRNGMKFVVYVSPFYSEAPDIFAEMQRILDEYQVDGFYFDGIADDFRESYRIIRRAREIVGENRILYVHDSLWDSYSGLVYFPFVDTYADYILRGEGGRLGLSLQDFLRWTVSSYNIGNAVGYWIYYGSNIDPPREQPTEYQTDRVPTTMHINAALMNEARIWRTVQSWGDQPRELERFDRDYYGGLESLRLGTVR